MKHSRANVAVARATAVFPDLEPPAPSIITRRDRTAANALACSRGHDASDAARGHLRASILSFANIGDHGNLLTCYLRARKRTFIDRLNWKLPQTGDMEFDQYDTPMCRWVVIHEFGEILGGVRLLPTTARCAVYSYMLRDAQAGILDNIPTDVLFFEAPSQPHIWEASRLFIAEVVPAQRRHDVQALLMRKMSEAASAEGARHVIGIVPGVFARWLRRLGMAAVPVGPKFAIDGTNSQAALFNVSRNVN